VTKISFIGDISLNGGYSDLAKANKNPFEKINNTIYDSHYVAGNLEAVAENNNEEYFDKVTRLKISYDSLGLLNNLKINLLTLANNHIYDQLYEGFSKTIYFLDKNGIEYIGATIPGKANNDAFIKDVAGFKIAFLNYVHKATNPKFPKDCLIDVNIYERNDIIERINNIRESVDFLILILHWGMDNSRYPAPWQRRDARIFANAGVDLIIGHHSHVLQGYEKIDNSWVFYSLGNFAFAPLKEGKENELANRQKDSIILHYILSHNKRNVEWIPIKLEGLNVVPSGKTKIEKLSKFIPFVSNPVVWPFYRFYVNIFYKIYFYFFGNSRNPFTQLKNIDVNKLKRAKQIITYR